MVNDRCSQLHFNYLVLLSISQGRRFHPQPKDAPCFGDREVYHADCSECFVLVPVVVMVVATAWLSQYGI
jgi:hypothetical protein